MTDKQIQEIAEKRWHDFLYGDMTALDCIESAIREALALVEKGTGEKEAFEAGVHAAEVGIDYENGETVDGAFQSWLRSLNH